MRAGRRFSPHYFLTMEALINKLLNLQFTELLLEFVHYNYNFIPFKIFLQPPVCKFLLFLLVCNGIVLK
jgi:hypothetical protein